MIEFETIQITKVEVAEQLLTSFEEQGFTYLHFKYYAPPKYSDGGWVNIWKTSYIVRGETELKLIDAINIPFAPQRHCFSKIGQRLNFVLVFPAIPKDWASFDFFERCERNRIGFSITNICRNNTGIYKLLIS